MSEDFAWFKEHYTDFQKKYGESFIAIKTKKFLVFMIVTVMVLEKRLRPKNWELLLFKNARPTIMHINGTSFIKYQKERLKCLSTYGF